VKASVLVAWLFPFACLALAGFHIPIRSMAPGGLCLAMTVACGWVDVARTFELEESPDR
jgi:hypothetical protein